MKHVAYLSLALTVSACVWGFCLRALHRGVYTPYSCLAGSQSAFRFSTDDQQDDGGAIKDPASNFDMDFAEAMSKPLPEWFLEEKQKKEELMEELNKNRERIMAEFRAKYEISNEEKAAEREKKDAVLELRRQAIASKKRKMKQQQSGSGSFLGRALGISTATKKSTANAVAKGGQEEEEDYDDDVTTRDQWEKFWEEEEETTGFSLPGFFEVFPELKLQWPTWAKKRDGSAVECEVDSDCAFPQACCPHPIIPGDKFCCTGWTQRIMVPAYQRQLIQADIMGRDQEGNNGEDGAPETGGYGMPEN